MIATALAGIPAMAFQVISVMGRIGGMSFSWLMLIAQFLSEITHFGIAIVLFAAAPSLTRHICGKLGHDGEPARIESIQAGDLYQVATFLMGIYVLVLAVGPTARAVVAMVELSRYQDYASELVEAVVYFVVGCVLLFGAKGFATFLGSLGHDPDKVPAPQFSVRVVMMVMMGVALLLVLIRSLVK
jgi:hypothetical protein